MVITVLAVDIASSYVEKRAVLTPFKNYVKKINRKIKSIFKKQEEKFKLSHKTLFMV